eukprot:TRINITY_DN13563_c0_g1_i2.p1 TRINITY_DN13563_c0_g1~~TRINITY_DN13563_c0_g1_i2.p1  ORF type:complete len:104 (+),score=39.43 TRINITY_DN13563_c0_g1_i2:102-413(+)
MEDNEFYKMLSDLEVNSSQINFEDFLRIFSRLKKANMDEDDQDTLAAFVAVGGEDNGDGYVDAGKLIEIIKKEFELTVDIEKMIETIDEDRSGKIEFLSLIHI